jgi:DNA phosphorothioation-associated DGQHR protein 1
VEAAFPNSVILAANYDEDGKLVEDEKYRWTVEKNAEGDLHLTIPTLKKIAAIVDGQHRLHGFEWAKIIERRSMPILCAIFLDLPNPFQAYVFATINYNQKPVSKSQTYELYGYNLEDEPPQAWSPEKDAVFLCRRLNTDPDSPFQGHIIVAAQDDRVLGDLAAEKKKQWAVSTATVVEGIMALFTANAKRDRDTMHLRRVHEGRLRSLLSSVKDGSPLRSLYLEENDKVLYLIVCNFFTAASNVIWSKWPGSFIQKTVGIQALFDILRLYAPDAMVRKDVSVEYFTALLEPCADIDFRDDFFHASGAGKSSLRRAMLFKLGRLNVADLGEDEEVYRKVTGKKD